ncbi:MAG TPA: hypothetical protein VHG51_01145 [Longimicrobiaceae bacterium]|nr:hypothetical protein [Longimicrobiaceae bacterium]
MAGLHASARILRRLLPALLLGACAPVVSHAPRVEPGPTFGLVAAARPCDSACAGSEPIPATSAVFRQGWVREDGSGPAASVGLSVPGVILFPLVELDFYVQAPAAPSAPVFGGGVLLAIDHQMPYVQAGRVPPGGSGWYTTQGLAFVTRTEGRGVAARYWSPALAYRLRGGELWWHVFVGGGIGTRYPDVETDPRRPLRFVMAGVVLERAGSWPPLFPERRPPSWPLP